MGHKRKKHAERKADKDSKGFNESPMKKVSSDTPKAFARIMFKKQQIEKRAQDTKSAKNGAASLPSLKNRDEDLGIDPKTKAANAKNHNNNNNKPNQPSDELRIKPGERMGDFSRRVEEHMRDKMLKTAKNKTAEGSKKKKYFEKLKAKKKGAKLQAEEDKAYEEYERLQDRVRLNDVAQAPPTLTAVPKKRKNDEKLATRQWKNTPGEEDYDDLVPDDIKRQTDQDEDPDKKRARLRNMTPAGRRILEAERKQAIENYRMVKARKLLDGGRRFPEHVGRNTGDDDDDEY
ncbi:hypothetical protein DFQ26_006297 [Actinomortierella ambigua]|nr:hypothetical protein DFQ26_006297 [Actinomortierella ambigua]